MKALQQNFSYITGKKAEYRGCNDEYISAPRLDDIQCAYSSLMAYIKALGEISDDYDK